MKSKNQGMKHEEIVGVNFKFFILVTEAGNGL